MVTYVLLSEMVTVLEFLDREGSSPFAEWFGSLDATAAAKVTTAVRRMELGNFSNVKGVGAGVFEYRIDFGPGYRVYFGKVAKPLSSCSEAGPRSANIATSRLCKSGGRATRSESRRRNENGSNARVQGHGASTH